MTDRDFINFLIKTCFSNARDPHLAILNNAVMNRLNDIAGKLEKQEKVLSAIKGKVIWIEDGKLMCGRYADTEIELDEEDFENKEVFETLKEWMK